jgi:ribosomal protein L10
LHYVSVLAAIVDDRLMSVNELVKYSKMPDLKTAQAGLIAVLNAATVQLTQNLTHHQQSFLGHLQKHIELQQKVPNEEEA